MRSDALKVVLVVDDDPIVRESLARSLDGSPYMVVPSDSAIHALALMGSVRVDAVIADVEMPGMNGARFLVYVRDMFPEVTRLILTGSRYSEVDGLLTAGVGREQVLRKDVGPEQLRRYLDEALAHVGTFTSESGSGYTGR